jgi:3-(3-hydroxy-phenyl)propionate hydroxylase
LSVQNVFFRWEDGSQGCVNDLIQWADGHLLLLVFGDQSAQARERLADLSRHAPVRCVQVLGADNRRQSLETVRDPLGHLQGACHVFGHAWALVRPDAYLAATGEAVDSALVRAIEHALALA